MSSAVDIPDILRERGTPFDCAVADEMERLMEENARLSDVIRRGRIVLGRFNAMCLEHGLPPVALDWLS